MKFPVRRWQYIMSLLAFIWGIQFTFFYALDGAILHATVMVVITAFNGTLYMHTRREFDRQQHEKRNDAQ